MINLLNLGLVIALALLHLLNGKLSWVKWLSGHRWQSFGTGISLAYLLVEILPELGRFQTQISQGQIALLDGLDNLIYLLVLVGLLTFYGLEQLAMRSQLHQMAKVGQHRTSATVFWLHISSFAIYNALFSYLLSHTNRLVSCLLFFVAIALHYLVNDQRLQEYNQVLYTQKGRWLLASAIITGWVIAQSGAMSVNQIIWIKSFLAGGLLLNIFVSELPQQLDRSFSYFAGGAGVYTLILLLARA